VIGGVMVILGMALGLTNYPGRCRHSRRGGGMGAIGLPNKFAFLWRSTCSCCWPAR
jgi:hypothetical protein